MPGVLAVIRDAGTPRVACLKCGTGLSRESGTGAFLCHSSGCGFRSTFPHSMPSTRLVTAATPTALSSAEDGALREAIAALLPFTSHDIGCAIYKRSWVGGEPPCTCGLDDARAKAALQNPRASDEVLGEASGASADGWTDYLRGIQAAKEWLRDQQHRQPPETLWHAAAILADRMDVALLSEAATPAATLALLTKRATRRMVPE